MKSELGSNSVLFAVAREEFTGLDLEDITEEMFFEIINEAKATEEDSEIFLSCLQHFDIYGIDEWEIEPDDHQICINYETNNHAIWEGHIL